MAIKSSRMLYVIMIIAIVVAAVAGFLAGQSYAPGATQQTLTIWRTATQVFTQTYVTTIQQPATTPPQTPIATATQTPTPEQLLAPIVEAARKEGKLIIYSTVDRPSAEPLLNAFKAKYPFIDLQYVELNSVQLYNRYVSERAAGAPTADILWSSGADLQYLLIQNGSAQPYRLTIYDRIPEAAKYRDLVYIPFFGLVAPIYSTQKVPKDLAPKSYSDILKLLTERKDLFPPRSVATFNIEGSAFALTFTYYLYKGEPDLIQKIFTAAGSIGVVMHTATGPQIEMIKTGQAVISTSLFANYAFREAVNDPRVGVFIPTDIVVLMPITMFITKEARNPNAAKLFMEFVFSDEGQKALAQTSNVIVMGDNPFYPQLSLKYIQANVRKPMIVRFGDGIIDELLKPDVRNSFISMWKKWLGIG
ncbi:MAG: extracellular solute-binding protein [Sulfolobales archaeon]